MITVWGKAGVISRTLACTEASDRAAKDKTLLLLSKPPHSAPKAPKAPEPFGAFGLLLPKLMPAGCRACVVAQQKRWHLWLRQSMPLGHTNCTLRTTSGACLVASLRSMACRSAMNRGTRKLPLLFRGLSLNLLLRIGWLQSMHCCKSKP